MIHGKNITFSYEFPASPRKALSGIDIDIAKGEFAVILGMNGSGKSTLCRHFNGLLPLQSGSLSVAGFDVSDEKSLWELRRRVGMVFQNPDNQFVSSVVSEDVSFGLENYQLPRGEIDERVSRALDAVGMLDYMHRATHTLSGGQKQRVAIAGVLALEPEVIILDEVTAMLDGSGRREVLKLISDLHRMGHTIVMVTHYVEEAVYADRVFLMRQGKLVASGASNAVLTDRDRMLSTGITPPVCVNLYYDLKARGICLPQCPLTKEELVNGICQLK